jgi:ubiquinone/menaquinone biosynthesis C-methylase UbiE
MPFAKLIADQMRKPSGMLGRFIVARSMNRTNVGISRLTIQLLNIQPADRVLDIGFGGGVTMEMMLPLAYKGLVAGIEVSDIMIKRAKKTLNNIACQGKAEVKEGAASQIPYESNYFDKVCTINCIYFWPDPADGLKEIIRVLKPSGALVIAVYLKEEFEKYPPVACGFNIYTDEELQKLLEDAGFINIRIERWATKPYTSVFAIGSK